MDNPEKQATRRRKTKQKHNIICIEHHYMQTNTNNVNKTCWRRTEDRFCADIATDITTWNSERKYTK